MTAVEFLSEQIRLTNSEGLRFQLWDAIEQAKEMEKQQIIDAWEDGQNSFPTINAEKYYKEQFKKK